MQKAINILRNTIRKDEKIARRYIRYDNTEAAENLQKEIDQLYLAIKFINEGIHSEARHE